MFNPGSVNLAVVLKRTASDLTKQPWLEMTKEIIVHIKNMQNDKMNIIQHVAYTFYRKHSDVTTL